MLFAVKASSEAQNTSQTSIAYSKCSGSSLLYPCVLAIGAQNSHESFFKPLYTRASCAPTQVSPKPRDHSDLFSFCRSTHLVGRMGSDDVYCLLHSPWRFITNYPLESGILASTPTINSLFYSIRLLLPGTYAE